MFPIRLDRDTPIIDWRAYEGGFGTDEVTKTSTTASVLSDGLTHGEYATVTANASPTIAANSMKCVGINMAGPESGDAFTPYQVSMIGVCDDLNVQPILIVGESIAAPTSGAAGDLITDVRIIAVCSAYGPEGASMWSDSVVLMNANTADRGVCFAVGFVAGAAGATAAACQARLSVRRLVDLMPVVFDANKL